MLPPGVLHMSALGRFGRFTLFSPRVSHSNTCRLLSFVCFVLLFGFVALVCFCFLFCECLGIPNSPRSLDLDDRQGLIARSAMQQKKTKKWFSVCVWLVLRCWFCLVAGCFVFFCCLILPGGIVALRKKLQWLPMVKQ